MLSEDRKKQIAWLTAAKRVEDVITMYPNAFTQDGLQRRKSFVDKVRACDGIGMDEVYSWTAIERLLVF